MNNSSYYLNQFKNITKQSAISTISLFGKNKKEEADKLAVEQMRFALGQNSFKSIVVIGEGEKDNAPMLHENEILGNGNLEIDLAVDPLECTNNFAKGLPNSLSVIAFSEYNKMISVPGTYMEQWVAGPKMKSSFNIEKPLKENLKILSENLEKKISELRIVCQDRPRHKELISELRNLDVSVCLIDSGSISAVLDICLELGNYDALIGTFGAPEGVISAIISKSTNSEFKAKLKPHEEKYKLKWESSGNKLDDVLDKNDFVKSEIFGFVATCISSNSFLKGIELKKNEFHGETILICKDYSKIEKW
jgi:fructose-1,6-bisphosphatase II